MQKEKTITIKSNTEQADALHFFKDVLGCSVKVVSDNMFIAYHQIEGKITVVNGKINGVPWQRYADDFNGNMLYDSGTIL